MRDVFQGQSASRRPKHPDRQDDDQHRCGDQAKVAGGAEILQKEGDEEAREGRRDAAEGIDEADRARPARAQEQPEERGGGESRLVGLTEEPVATGAEDAVADQAGRDAGGLEPSATSTSGRYGGS